MPNGEAVAKHLARQSLAAVTPPEICR